MTHHTLSAGGAAATSTGGSGHAMDASGAAYDTKPAETVAAETVAADDRCVPQLPLVSIVIVNYNYGRFLSEAVESVFQQTYPRIECVLVDNGSTDESHAVIEACARRHPSLQVLRRDTNGGQTVACCEGLARTRGPYVIFLDADDYLLPHGVATHLAVHLSSREHVGFTSGDMLQIVDGAIVVSTSDALNHAYRAAPAGTDLLRLDAVAVELVRRLAPVGIEAKVRLVDPSQSRWVWAPTSGNCFRRDALDLFFDGEGLGRLKSQTDLLLVLAVNAVSGSILVDEPVFAYRLHGANVFTSRPQLRGVLSFDTRLSSVPADTAKRLILETFTRHVGRFVQERWRGKAFFRHLKRLDVPTEDGGSLAARCVVAHYGSIVEAAGRFRTLLFLASRGLALPTMVSLALRKGNRS